MSKHYLTTTVSLVIFSLVSCTSVQQNPEIPQSPTLSSRPTSTPDRLDGLSLYISPDLPDGLMDVSKFPANLAIADHETTNSFTYGLVDPENGLSSWVYVLVAPFPTVADDIDFSELLAIWKGSSEGETVDIQLLVTQKTLSAFEFIWGKASSRAVAVATQEEILKRCWEQKSWAIIPFEELSPEWKVITVDEDSPLVSTFSLETYPLKVNYGLQNNGFKPDLLDVMISSGLEIPGSNFNAGLMTSVLMTGTTALVRSTAERMETKGIFYPGEAIAEVLRDADLTHISNEVSFSPSCPNPNPMIISLRFCSKPEYLPLLEEMGIDIVELTGNHLLDFNTDAFLYTLDLYRQNSMKYFGGGKNQDEAQAALKITHHKNKLAFMGCHAVGPDFAWAGEVSPGAAKCDFEWMQNEIARLTDEGYLVIATLQDGENYDIMPMPWVKEHMDQLSQAGAVVVSGSQSHVPQGLSFSVNGIIHYGLGNLFFDQMDYPVAGIRRQFYDKHFLYDGRYINTQLITGMLEDYAQPRLMSDEERASFLEEIFAASGW